LAVTEIVLPFPAKILWPNGRGHWAEKGRETKKHRLWALGAALSLRLPKPEGRVNVSLTIHPKTAHAIDADNAVASCKAYLDGIAQALGVNDSTFNAPSVFYGLPVKGGKVIITLDDA
jgi:crossover junction endodeoxyribonuclease RusA